MKPKSPWADAHLRLKRLYDERAPQGMTQKEFGERYGIGSQSMVAQLLNGIRPLNYDTAAKFAKGLRCTITDISPKMAESLRDDVIPVLGKALRRAAVVLLAFLLQQLASFDAKAGGFSHNVDSGVVTLHNSLIKYTLCSLRRFLSFMSAIADKFRQVFRDGGHCRAF